MILDKDNILDLVEEPGPDLEPGNLLKHIWFYPTNTLQYLLKRAPTRNVHLFFMLYGIVSSLNNVSNQNLGDQLGISLLLIFTVIIGAALGLLSGYFNAWFMSLTGEWLGGKAKPGEYRTILAWALVPSIAGVILFAAKLGLLGTGLFTSELEVERLGISAVIVVMSILQFGLWIWSFIILIRGIALIQAFSVGRAIGNVLLAGLILFIAIFMLSMFLIFVIGSASMGF